MRIGDVQAVLALVIASALGIWGALIIASLLFNKKTERAAYFLTERPTGTTVVGAVLAVLGIGLGIVLMKGGGLAMFLGWVLLLFTLLVALIGCAGMVNVVADRIQPLSPVSPFAAKVRAAGLMVFTGFLPGFGWLLLFPLQLFAGLGAGIKALSKAQVYTAEQTLPQVQ